jgi:hypothetical protein
MDFSPRRSALLAKKRGMLAVVCLFPCCCHLNAVAAAIRPPVRGSPGRDEVLIWFSSLFSAFAARGRRRRRALQRSGGNRGAGRLPKSLRCADRAGALILVALLFLALKRLVRFSIR